MPIRPHLSPLPRLVAALGVAAFLFTLTQTSSSFAQSTEQLPEANFQRWRPSPFASDFLMVHSSLIDEHLGFNGGFYFNYANDPLLVRHSSGAELQAAIDYQLFADFMFSMSFFEWFELGIVLPVGIGTGTSILEMPFEQLRDEAGLGDMRFAAKGRILRLGDFPVGLGLIAIVTAPTGDTKALFGDDGVSFDIISAIEFNPWGKVRMAGNLGFRYRPEPAVVKNFTMGHSLLLSGAAAIPFFSEDLDLLLEIHGEITVDGANQALSSEERPVEAELGFRYRLWKEPGILEGLAVTGALGAGTTGMGSPSVRAIVGIGWQWVSGGAWAHDYDYGGYLSEIEECPDPETTPPEQIPDRCRTKKPVDSDGDGVPDNLDRCPFLGQPGQVDQSGCPNNDRDADGIPDHVDKCPDSPEDFDGWLDSDGCPEPDNDQDGIPDVVDGCPIEAEIFNGIDDEDGCPDDDPNAKVSVRHGKLEIREQVFFETGKAVILPASYALLDEVARVLDANPHVGLIDIEGHTDDRGDEAMNKKLSQERADSVRSYLIEAGVESSRLNAIGYGEERPIDTNDTKEGRARNRRVEFVIRGIDDK